jgi:dynein heavy chain, axonemal
LKDVLEEMDPVLEPVLARAFFKRGNQVLIKLGDKELDYNPDFKLYISTKLGSPTYSPEISTKVMIINFAVKEDGLEAQLLNLVVKMERPDLDKQKNELVVKVAKGKRTQVHKLTPRHMLRSFWHLDAEAVGTICRLSWKIES